MPTMQPKMAAKSKGTKRPHLGKRCSLMLPGC